VPEGRGGTPQSHNRPNPACADCQSAQAEIIQKMVTFEEKREEKAGRDINIQSFGLAAGWLLATKAREINIL